jgi:hypothetical protein
MDTLDDSDSSITQLTTDIENIQKQMKVSRDKLASVAVQMAVDSLLFGAQVGIAVSQLPLINEDVEDSIIHQWFRNFRGWKGSNATHNRNYRYDGKKKQCSCSY